MPSEERATAKEQGLAEIQARLDSILEKAVAHYGTYAVARMIVDLAGRYRDIFKAEVTRAQAEWNMEHPGGHA